MRIAFINNTNKWGGVKTWTLSMAQSLTRAGHGASVFGKDPVFIQKALDLGLDAVQYSPGPDYNPLAIRFYARMLRKKKADVVVVNVGKDLRTAGVAAKLLGLPLIHRVGAPGDFRDTCQTRWEARLLQPKYLCCSEYVLERLQRNVSFVGGHERAAIHPGTAIPEQVSFEEHSPLRLVTTSRLNPDKGHRDLLGALALLKNEGLLFSLDVVGSGPLREELEAFARKNGLAEQVLFSGFTVDVARHLKEADVFVLPSLHEPLGIALEEGLAHGLIPIARNAGGVPEIWPEAAAELLVPEGAGPEDFARVLRAVAAMRPEERRALREKVRTHAETACSQEKQFAAFFNWVEKTVAAHRDKGR